MYLKRSASHLNSQVGDDGPLVALQCLQGDLSDLRFRLPHEHLAGGGQHLLVLTLDLHLRVRRQLVCNYRLRHIADEVVGGKFLS